MTIPKRRSSRILSKQSAADCLPNDSLSSPAPLVSNIDVSGRDKLINSDVSKATKSQVGFSSSSKVIRRISYCALLVLALFASHILFCISILASPTVQANMVFMHFLNFPMGNLSDPSRFFLLGTRNIQVTTDDDITIRGWHLLPTNEMQQYAALTHSGLNNETQLADFFDSALGRAERVIIYLHGQGSNRALNYRVQLIKSLAAQFNAHVVTFDYRGFGDSAGFPSEAGTRLDCFAVYSWLETTLRKHRRDFPPIYIYGHSLGTGIGSSFAREINERYLGSIAGLILEAPYYTMLSAANEHPTAALFNLPGFWDALHKHATIQYSNHINLKKIGTPTLIFHGRHDRMIPVTQTRRLLREHAESACFAALSNAALPALDLPAGAANGSSVLLRFVETDSGHLTNTASPQYLHEMHQFMQFVEDRNHQAHVREVFSRC